MRIHTLRLRVHQVLDGGNYRDRTARVVGAILIAVILLNVTTVCLETVPSLDESLGKPFRWIEIISVAIFTLEYLLRIWSCTASAQYRHPITGRIRYGLKPLSLVDLLVILPTFVAGISGVDLRTIRAFRLIRLARLLKLGRYSESLRTLGAVLDEKKEELSTTFVCIAFLLVTMSSVIYYVERDAQPEAYSSIPETMWWTVITLTTVGYGDTYPITGLGRFLGGLVALVGIGVFALPAGILASGFGTVVKRRNQEEGRCPHCGQLPPSTEDQDETPDPDDGEDAEEMQRAA